MLRILSQEATLLNSLIAELRDEKIQQDRMRFRFNTERIGEIMAYEISKTFEYQPAVVVTPLGEAETVLPVDKVVIASIMRAGIPMHNGFLNMFKDADNAFVAAYRKYHKDGSMKINLDYMSTADIEDKILIILDPMLATGVSMELTYNALVAEGGRPKHTHIVSIISSAEGIEFASKRLPANVTFWTVAMDEELTVKSYIVPGIGDMGDLAYGNKL